MMKSSKVNIGQADAKVFNAKHVTPACEPPALIGDFDVELQKKKLANASWSSGQYQAHYASIKHSSYNKHKLEFSENTKRQLMEMKQRISQSSVLKDT